ncbi:MAG TPA: porin [Acidiferrobacterales bacterium]|jgi:hypothetical protein
MTSKRLMAVPITALLAWTCAAGAASVDELDQRLRVLEQQTDVYKEEIEDLTREKESKIRISGYVDAEYSRDSRPNVKPGFRMHHLSFFFKKQISSNWRFFSEVEYEDAPKFEGNGESQPAPAEGEIATDAEGKIFVEAVYIDYLPHPAANVRTGRFFTPAGIWSIDHYPPFVPTQRRPSHVRQIFPQVVDGMDFFGSIPVGKAFFGYDLYFGNGEGNTGKQDQNSTKAVGAKASLLLPFLDQLELGATAYDDRLNNDDEKFSWGTHARIRAGMFAFQAEYADAKIEPVAAATYHRRGYYGQLVVAPTDKWAVGYRYDYYDERSIAVRDEKTNSVFVNYRAHRDIVLKVEHHDIQDEDPAVGDYRQTILSIVYYLAD